MYRNPFIGINIQPRGAHLAKVGTWWMRHNQIPPGHPMALPIFRYELYTTMKEGAHISYDVSVGTIASLLEVA